MPYTTSTITLKPPRIFYPRTTPQYPWHLGAERLGSQLRCWDTGWMGWLCFGAFWSLVGWTGGDGIGMIGGVTREVRIGLVHGPEVKSGIVSVVELYSGMVTEYDCQ